MKFNFLILTSIIFLKPPILNAINVDYLLQSSADPNKVELITDISTQNILYLKPQCEKCLDSALKILNTSKINFIIVVGTKPIENLFQYLNKNKVPKSLWSVFYLDPGLRYTDKLKIRESNSVFINQKMGQTKMNFNINLATRMPKDSELEIWK